MGTPVSADEAEEQMFGFVLLNDWSARDIRGLKMNPLGTFSGKSFGTTISPWIIPLAALDPFKLPVPPSRDDDAAASTDLRTNTTKQTTTAATAPYLTREGDPAHYALTLRAELINTTTTTVLCRSRLDWLHWTFRDMLTQQTANGCGLRAGGLLAKGTVSGPREGQFGCLLGITRAARWR